MKCCNCRKANNNGANSCAHCGEPLVPMIALKDLDFTENVSSHMAVDLEDVKVGLLENGSKKKLLTAIQTNSFCYRKVKVFESYENVGGEDNNHYSYYAKVQTLDGGNAISAGIPRDVAYKPTKGEETYLIKVKLGSKFKYAVIPSVDVTYIKANFKDILSALSEDPGSNVDPNANIFKRIWG